MPALLECNTSVLLWSTSVHSARLTRPTSSKSATAFFAKINPARAEKYDDSPSVLKPLLLFSLLVPLPGAASCAQFHINQIELGAQAILGIDHVALVVP